ncbi:hypothetical protein DL93DRAFT_2081863 [Clavulina sp. PMI_390]|nr:hypothetical protein DL93DRAFT_2081863 [Clavulina sp. PMI_390]
MDPSYFLQCFSLPSSDPESIHPCLLNACYLGACIIGGRAFSPLEPFFLRRTRHFLHQALMFADRLTHFFWSSVILCCYFARTRRMEESFAVISAAGRLASACGLKLTHSPRKDVENDTSVTGSLLPTPRNENEARDRDRLAHSMYITDQSLTMLCPYPATFPYDDRQEDEKLSLEPSKTSKSEGREAQDIWCSDENLMASMMRIFERATVFARSVCAYGYKGNEKEYINLRDRISSHRSTLPAIPDPRGLQPSEAAASFNSNILVAHATLYGSGVILHSLRAGEDFESRAALLLCVKSLVDVSEKVRGHRRLHPVQAGLISMIHMMNAVRILAHELQKPEAHGNARLSAEYCDAMEILLDYLDDTISLYPAWLDAPLSLKGALITAANTLPI